MESPQKTRANFTSTAVKMQQVVDIPRTSRLGRKFRCSSLLPKLVDVMELCGDDPSMTPGLPFGSRAGWLVAGGKEVKASDQ